MFSVSQGSAESLIN